MSIDGEIDIFGCQLIQQRAHGIRGLYDSSRPGRPKILTPEDEEFIHKIST